MAGPPNRAVLQIIPGDRWSAVFELESMTKEFPIVGWALTQDTDQTPQYKVQGVTVSAGGRDLELCEDNPAFSYYKYR